MIARFLFTTAVCAAVLAAHSAPAEEAKTAPRRAPRPGRAARRKSRKPPPLTTEAQRVAAELKKTLPPHSEARLMLDAILKGSRLGPGSGWFRVAKAKSRFGWGYVAKKFDRDRDGQVTPKEFGGSESDFQRLDRDGDGALTEADFDWEGSALSRTPGARLFSMADRDGNGRVTREEFAQLFESFDSGKRGFLSLADLKDRLQPPVRKDRRKRNGGPSRSTLVLALARQELGGLRPGPDLNEKAPDFTLPFVNRPGTVTLSKEIGEKPVVLVFGSFT